MLVLRRKGTLDFICIAKTLDELKKKINRVYWNTNGQRAKGSVFELSDFLEDKVISKLTVEDLQNDTI
jgi:hypothetical protein